MIRFIDQPQSLEVVYHRNHHGNFGVFLKMFQVNYTSSNCTYHFAVICCQRIDERFELLYQSFSPRINCKDDTFLAQIINGVKSLDSFLAIVDHSHDHFPHFERIIKIGGCLMDDTGFRGFFLS